MIEAKVICDSTGEHSPRLTTFRLRYPKFIHGEFMTHRTFSRNASSSRAIPVSKNLEEVRNDELRAAPVWWGREQKGMASGDKLTGGDKASAIAHWRKAAWDAANRADELIHRGVHKSIVNRILEPFLHINVVMTSCEPGLLNFFGLRLDKAAQPEIRVLAEQMWAAWNESKPTKLEPGQWHLPFITQDELGPVSSYLVDARLRDESLPEGDTERYLSVWKPVSVARCARVSYLSFETGRRSTIEEDLKLYDRLVGAQPMHASPAEHQATPDEVVYCPNASIQDHVEGLDWYYVNLDEHGNLPGWRQYRKMLPGEAVAPLPEGYALTTKAEET